MDQNYWAKDKRGLINEAVTLIFDLLYDIFEKNGLANACSPEAGRRAVNAFLKTGLKIIQSAYLTDITKLQLDLLHTDIKSRMVVTSGDDFEILILKHLLPHIQIMDIPYIVDFQFSFCDAKVYNANLLKIHDHLTDYNLNDLPESVIIPPKHSL
jgi:hypothetical protein